MPPGPVPTVSPKAAYGRVSLAPLGSVQQVGSLLPGVTHPWPLTFEKLSVPHGLVIYETTVPFRIVSTYEFTMFCVVKCLSDKYS